MPHREGKRSNYAKKPDDTKAISKRVFMRVYVHVDGEHCQGNETYGANGII